MNNRFSEFLEMIICILFIASCIIMFHYTSLLCMTFSYLKKIKVNQKVYNKLVDMYAYNIRNLSPTHVFFVEGDCRFESGFDLDYSNLSYKELVLKLAENLLFIYG